MNQADYDRYVSLPRHSQESKTMMRLEWHLSHCHSTTPE